MSSHHEVAVIGGGQAGLAIGYHLAQQDRHFTILEAAARPAAAWRSRWQSLRLFTPARHDSLPGLAFPGDPDHYPTRDEVVAYLTHYAQHFDLPVELDSRVSALRHEDGVYAIELDDRTYTADQVVAATGPFQAPRVPPIADALDTSIIQLHSSDYRSPHDIAAGSVLVVGGGNTGYQIAEELSATHDVHLAIGSRQMPMPQRLFGRDLFSYLTKAGLMDTTRDSPIGRRLRDRETLVGSSPRAARRREIQLHGRASGAAGSTVQFADDSNLEVRTVIWATGFTVDHGWIDAPIFDAAGAALQDRGVTPSTGLYFLGLPWQHTRGSALLGWVKHDAAHLADHIGNRGATRSALPTAPSRRTFGPLSNPRSRRR